MTNDLQASIAFEGRPGDSLTEEARMAILHAKALAAYVDLEENGKAVFPSRIEGEEYEVIVRKRDPAAQRDLFG